ncbi:acetylcholinesterase-like isoform X3 [Dermacentor andersoni]|uniref:acetylcholinesterase-like isoform X3 n=1 Tax=Dermacentor andersoni TaxID=34620 RepID=UPI0024171263|nr:acetylcholinesterase-like isoform X3 [Dermacentor andersoni]
MLSEGYRLVSAARTVTLTDVSLSADTGIRHLTSEEIAGHSEDSTSASVVETHTEKGTAHARVTRNGATRSLAARSPLRTERSRPTTLLSGATSPSTADSAASVGRRPREDVASEPKEEPKVDEPELQRAVESGMDPGAKPKIEPLVLPNLEHRMLEPSLLPPRSPPGRRDLHQPLKMRDLRDRPKVKRSLCNRLFAPGLTVVLVLTIAVLSTALMEHWWNRDRPMVRGLFGAVRGEKIVVSDQGRLWTVHAFLGVPFAKAPRGPLRFKPPQPLDTPLGRDERGNTLDSLAKRPPCPQQDFYLGQQLVNTANGSEDCLHVNIWVPARNCSPDAEPSSCRGKTVLFFLYGASFQNGGNSFELYDGRYLSALGDLVVVVPNYRVGALGFLSGPSANTLPGNVGLHDQRLALSWTLANIEHFGGNTSRLVLAGHDAGATSLGYHLFSGDSGFWTRSVTRFILQSGGPFHRYGGDGVKGTIRLATGVQCVADLVTEESLRCLQNAPVDAVARSKMAPTFVPVFKRAPLSRPQMRLALETPASEASGPQGKQFLLGRVQNEGSYPWFVEQQRTGSGDPQQLAALLIGQDNLDRWQNATGVVLDPTVADESYQEAVGDVLEACPMSQLAEQLHAWKNRVYAYVLAYRPTYSSWTDETEAVHFEDVELVFGVPLRPGAPSGELDKQWSRTMIRVWSTFARTGVGDISDHDVWKFDAGVDIILGSALSLGEEFNDEYLLPYSASLKSAYDPEHFLRSVCFFLKERACTIRGGANRTDVAHSVNGVTEQQLEEDMGHLWTTCASRAMTNVAVLKNATVRHYATATSDGLFDPPLTLADVAAFLKTGAVPPLKSGLPWRVYERDGVSRSALWPNSSEETIGEAANEICSRTRAFAQYLY